MVTVSADDGNGDITEVDLGPIGSHIDSWIGDRDVMPLTSDEHTYLAYRIALLGACMAFGMPCFCTCQRSAGLSLFELYTSGLPNP